MTQSRIGDSPMSQENRVKNACRRRNCHLGKLKASSKRYAAFPKTIKRTVNIPKYWRRSILGSLLMAGKARADALTPSEGTWIIPLSGPTPPYRAGPAIGQVARLSVRIIAEKIRPPLPPLDCYGVPVRHAPVAANCLDMGRPPDSRLFQRVAALPVPTARSCVIIVLLNAEILLLAGFEDYIPVRRGSDGNVVGWVPRTACAFADFHDQAAICHASLDVVVLVGKGE